MKKLLLSLAFILCSVITLFASHQAGYHISMKWISGDNYRFTIISYRDATGISLPSYFDFKIYSKSTNLVVKNFGMNLISDLGLYNSPNNGNCNGSVLAISRGVYQSSLINLQNLNDSMGYYAASDGECCRTSNILNIDGTTSTVYAMQFPAVGSLSPFTHYSSPVISSDPIFNATSGITYNYNLNATDADNDSLVYSMTEPLELVSGGTFVPVAFTPGYNLQTNIMGSLPSSNMVDNLSGKMVMTPYLSGLYVVAIKVEDFSRYPNIFKKGEIRVEFPIQVSQYGTNRIATFDALPTDTVKIQAGTNACLPVKASLTQPGTIVMQASSVDTIFASPGAKFGLIPNAISNLTLSASDSIKGYFCWTPSLSAVRPGVYPIKIKIYDTFCVDLVKDSTTILVQVIDTNATPAVPILVSLSTNTNADPKIGTFSYSVSSNFPNPTNGTPQLFAYSRLLDSLSSRVSFNKTSELSTAIGTLNWAVQCSDTINSPYIVTFVAKNPLNSSDSVVSIINFTVDACKASAIAELAPSSLKIFPNPATNKLFVELNKNLTNVKMNVIDAKGKEVISTIAKQDFINLENLQQGVYFIRVVADEGVLTRRFTVLR